MLLFLLFYHYLELHHSQTNDSADGDRTGFYHYLELHHSQTPERLLGIFVSFTTIWNYITLKQMFLIGCPR